MNWSNILLRKTRLGVTWLELEQESGVSRRTFSNWHGGITKPDDHKLKAFLDALERRERQAERRAGK